MLRQRILAAIIVRDGMAVQSFGFRRYLPLGDVSCLVQNLDRWGVDGIVILSIDRAFRGPDLSLLKKLTTLNLATPVTYGGGIRTPEDALLAVQSGAERLIIDRALSDGQEQLQSIAAVVGKQALIASVPLIFNSDDRVYHWKYWDKSSASLSDWILQSSWPKYVSEILCIDVLSDGSSNGPNLNLFPHLYNLNMPTLLFGGFRHVSDIETALLSPGVAAVVIGNALNYREDCIRHYKDFLSSLPLRPHPSFDLAY